jgi:hypothetical protein
MSRSCGHLSPGECTANRPPPAARRATEIECIEEGCTELTGYGGTRELLIGIGILVITCLLYAYRRLAEDRQSVRMRDLTEDGT